MSVSSGSSSTTTVPPPTGRKEQAVPSAQRKTWLAAIAPAYLGIFVWAPFYDRLWVSDLVRFNLAWLFAAALGGALLCHVFFYWGLADWGFRTGLSLDTLAASTFGTAGSRWLVGFAVALANVVICAIAIDFAVDSSLLGLLSCGLIDPADLGRWNVGPFTLGSPVFVGTALFWIVIISVANLLRLIGVVAALMRVYAPVALLVVTLIGVWSLPGLRFYRFDHAAVSLSAAGLSGASVMGPAALQLICGYFALAGLASVDRGAAVRRRRDVVLGGAAGIVLAGAWCAVMALVVVASAVGRASHSGGLDGVGHAIVEPLTYRWAILHGIGGSVGGTILILLGLAAMAPGCYASWVYGHRLASLWPRVSPAIWVWAGGLIAFLLVVSSCAARTGVIFCIMGDILGPVIGAMLGDRLGQRRAWSGPRGAFNSVGLLAWGIGSLLALTLDLALMRNPGLAGWMPPTSLLGLFCAGLVYRLLAAIGREPATDVSRESAIPAELRTLAQ
ncbi:MAG: hypothetical protein ACLQVF_26730 [Isosphaeraceae bacterium]